MQVRTAALALAIGALVLPASAADYPDHGSGPPRTCPGFAPVGPYILTMDEVADTDDLWVTCDVK